MKGIIKLVKKFDIKGFLIINYILIFIILFFALRLSSASAYFIVQKFIYKNQSLSYSNLSTIYNNDFNKINIDFIEKAGGWAEVLDENKRVIFIKGEKKDNIVQYTETELLEIVSPQEPYSAEKPYAGQAAVVSGKNGEKNYFLIKYDKRKFSSTTVYDPIIYDKNDIPIILSTKGIGYLFICLYLLAGIYVYSRLSSRFITTPLREFVNGLKKMKQLDYSTRLNTRGLKELEEVENEFNLMAQKLQQAEKEKKQIDESKKRFLVDISHDLRTPVTSIQGFSKLLLEEDISFEKQKKFLNIIYEKSSYSSLLIEDLFQLSKLEDFGYNIELIKDDFCEWLRRLIAEYFEEFSSKGFYLNIDISERPLIIGFDHKLMKRAILNILTNCLKYNHAGTTLGITCYPEENSLVLQIGDNGRGVEEALKDRIFEPFAKSQEKKSESTGLGLAITKKIIERHGGSITLSCNPEYKTLFVISIPI